MKNSFPNKGTAVEHLIRREFAYELGLYLQTCAHIEMMASALIVCLRGLEPESEDWFHEYCKVRKLHTDQFLKQLGKCSEAAKKFGFSDELSKLSDWIKRFVQNRHMAAHGAFFDSHQGFMRVDFVKKTGTKNEPKFQRENTAVTREQVDVVLKDADRIYLTLLSMIALIHKDLPSRIHQRVVPIVEHPT
ncbi:hypothetical protein [Ruegeria arenilitoris]|uniref:hypothetical protein n=1 Tax=Ruegeria arenilitoris TaxID=1173585 RepID=UPI00147E6AB7|nr:hypothetical protein [Ruegeria arenilitoris]